MIAELVSTVNQATSQTWLKKYLSNFHWNQIASHLTRKIITIILLSLLFVIFQKIGKWLINRSFMNHPNQSNSAKRNLTLQTLSLNTFRYGLAFFWIYSILSVIGIPVGTLVTGAGIFSLAIGLGAQGFVSDLVSGFFILFERQINVGEYVIINHIQGTVTSIGLRTTQITAPDGTLNFIPNRNITTIANLSRNNMVAIIHIRINPDTPIPKALAVIQRTNQQRVTHDPSVIGTPDVRGVVNLPDNLPALEIYVTAKNGAQFKVQRDCLSYYLEALTKAGIQLPKNPIIKN